MAQLVRKKLASGALRFQVRWREDGRNRGPRFATEDEAKTFKKLVEACGNTMPDDDLLIARGFGDLAQTLHEVDVAQEKPVTVTFGELAEEYVRERYHLGYIAKKTYRDYMADLRLHLKPYLGDRPISDITRSELKEWQQTLLRTPKRWGGENETLTAVSVNHIARRIVRPVFARATRPGDDGSAPLIPHNPADGWQLLEEDEFIRDWLETPEQVKFLFKQLYAISEFAGDVAVTLAATGCRLSEILSLRCLHVNITGQTVSIRKAKNGRARTIPIPAALAELLKKYCTGKKHDALVFPNPAGQQWETTNWYRNCWNSARDAFQEKFGKTITPHCLRHSILTELGDSELDVKTIQGFSGHQTASVLTDVYMHPTNRNADKVRGVVEGVLASVFNRDKAKGNKAHDVEVRQEVEKLLSGVDEKTLVAVRQLLIST